MAGVEVEPHFNYSFNIKEELISSTIFQECLKQSFSYKDKVIEELQNELLKFNVFAWATFDGEGSYDLRLYEGNEDYLENFIKQSGEKYSGWVFPLYERF